MTATPLYRCVVFDCDSTLSAIEGIDELCADLPPDQAARVAGLTTAAMAGEVPLADVYAQRLDLVRPSRADLDALGELYVEHLVPGAREAVETLLGAGVSVHVVSGGLAPAVLVLALELGLDVDAVHAVGVHFDDDGRYVDFDRASPLTRNDGKVEVLRRLRQRRSPLLFVGDGVTDLEAEGVVDLFVGYGGVSRRAAVERRARHYVADPDLRFVLGLVLRA